jgi:hypothetical protein
MRPPPQVRITSSLDRTGPRLTAADPCSFATAIGRRPTSGPKASTPWAHRPAGMWIALRGKQTTYPGVCVSTHTPPPPTPKRAQPAGLLLPAEDCGVSAAAPPTPGHPCPRCGVSATARPTTTTTTTTTRRRVSGPLPQTRAGGGVPPPPNSASARTRGGDRPGSPPPRLPARPPPWASTSPSPCPAASLPPAMAGASRPYPPEAYSHPPTADNTNLPSNATRQSPGQGHHEPDRTSPPPPRAHRIK